MPNYRRDFTDGALYFFTLVLQNRNALLLTTYIKQFREAYQETLHYYPFQTIAICILPDHLHLIMRLPEGDSNYSIRIQALKRNFTKRLPTSLISLNESKISKREKGIWQRRFWEHRIRDEQDLEKYIHYIYYNPVKHGYTQSVSDWQFSSFHRDVKNGFIEPDWGTYVPPEITE